MTQGRTTLEEQQLWLVTNTAKRPRSARLAALRLGPIPGRLVSVGAAALVFAGFFLPWMAGAGPFETRAFSGFDFARLVRNFEIIADSLSSTAPIRGTAIAIYLMPALAINGAILHIFAAFAKLPRRLVGWALVLGGAYSLTMLAILLFFSLAPFTPFEATVGLPRWGFVSSLSGGLLLAWLGQQELRTPE